MPVNEMFSHRINDRIELRLIQQPHCHELFALMNSNRAHLRPWHPWIDLVRCPADAERFITNWLQQFARNRGFHAGIWCDGELCGDINHLNIDWANRSTVLSYWLSETHQGRGIMTVACRAFVGHAFDTLKLNRVTIECASGNTRSRRIPQRLGFQFEGTIRAAEWLHDHYADHAIYGLLKGDNVREKSEDIIDFSAAAPELPATRFAVEVA